MNYFEQFLKNRGMTVLDFERAGAYTPMILKGTDFLCDCLHQLPKDYPIGFISDFDTDGLMSGFIGYVGLRLCGFTNIHLSLRDTSHYPFYPEDVDKLCLGDKGVIITADVGIGCHEAVSYAKRMGYKVFITDHHKPDKGPLPAADCIIDCVTDTDYLSCNTACCGAYTIYQVFVHYARLFPEDVSAVGDLMLLQHFAAIATVTDRMPFTGLNRHIIKDMAHFFNYVAPTSGDLDIVDRMCSDGVLQNALTNFCIFVNILRNDAPGRFSVDFIDWTLGPVINSIKRMNADGGLLYNLLFSDRAEDLSVYLKDLNTERKTIINEEFDSVFIKGVNQMFPDTCYMTDLGSGMMGLLAAKILNVTGLPSFVIGCKPYQVRNGGGYVYGGSVRSPEWYPFFTRVNASGLAFCKGHEVSCGIEVPASNLYDLYEFLQRDIEDFIPEQSDISFDVTVDCIENIYDFEHDIRDFMSCISYWGPFGPGLEPPQVLLKLDIYHIRMEPIKDGDHTKVWFGERMYAMLWNTDPGEIYYSAVDGVLYLSGHFKYGYSAEGSCVAFEGSICSSPDDTCGEDTVIDNTEICMIQ